MSRVGNKPVIIPDKTQVNFKDGVLSVKGPKGEISRKIDPAVNLNLEDTTIRVELATVSRSKKPFQGLYRSLIANMVTGVNQGFQRVLEINGIGYRANINGKTIVLNLGYSHPIDFKLPDGVDASVDKNNAITLSGIDKALLGQTAASLRSLRPPEPYKGKGVKYAEERIQRKAGKTGTK